MPTVLNAATAPPASSATAATPRVTVLDATPAERRLTIDAEFTGALPPARRVLAIGCRRAELGARYERSYPGSSWHDLDDIAAVFSTAEPPPHDLIVLGDGLPNSTDPLELFDALARWAEPGAQLVLQFENAATLDALERVVEADFTETDAPVIGRHSVSSIYKLLMDAGWMPSLAGHRLAPAARQGTAAAALTLADTLNLPRGSVKRSLSMQQLIVRARRVFEDAPAVSGSARFDVVVPTTRDRQLRLNVQASPGLKEVGARILSCRDARNPAEALAASLPECEADWVLLCHQDVYFPRGFGARLNAVLAAVPADERERTLIGFVGMGVNSQTHGYEPAGFVIDRLEAADHPGSEQAMSIDELAIVISRRSIHRIDPAIGWHLWATDLCLTAICQHQVFPRIVRLPLFHNSVTDYELPGDFAQAAARLAAKYPAFQAIPTLCTLIDADFLATGRPNPPTPPQPAALPTPVPAPTPATTTPITNQVAGLAVDQPALNAQIDTLIFQQRHGDVLAAIARAVHESYLLPGIAHNTLYYPALDRRIEALAQLLDPLLPRAEPGPAGLHLIVATELYRIGGHSKVVEDLSHQVPAPVLVLTDLFGTYEKDPQQLAWIRERFAHATVITLPPGSLWDKCRRLGELTRRARPVSISYLAHHQDPVAYVGTLTQPNVRKVFFHHADHNPALGCTLAGVRHVDLSPALQEHCSATAGARADLLPMHVPDQGLKRFVRFQGQAFSVVTAGHPAKFVRSGPMALQRMVSSSLQAIDGRFFHVGPLDADWIAEIRAHLASQQLDPQRFVSLGQVPSLWKTLLEIDAAFYIGSAPVAGGRGSIEAQGCGLPILFFNGFETGPLVENYSLFADPALGWRDVEELGALLRNVGTRHAKLSKAARHHYTTRYSRERFRRVTADLLGE